MSFFYAIINYVYLNGNPILEMLCFLFPFNVIRRYALNWFSTNADEDKLRLLKHAKTQRHFYSSPNFGFNTHKFLCFYQIDTSNGLT